MGNGKWAIVNGRVAAFGAMLAMGWFFRCNHLTDWDSWDYAAQAIMGQSSDLMLGRWWFIAVMRGAWLAGHGLFGLGTAEAYLPMQAVSALMMAGAVVAGMAWTRRLTGSAAAEAIFAAIVVMGPIIGLYTFSVMTEGMTLLTLSLAMWAWEVSRGGVVRLAPTQREACASGEPSANSLPSGSPLNSCSSFGRTTAPTAPGRAWLWALGAGLAFGVAVDVREPVLAVGAWPLVSCLIDRGRRRWRLLAAAGAGTAITLGIGVLGAWAWYPWRGMAVWHVAGMGVDVSYFEGMRGWWGQMAKEKMQHHVSIAQNLAFLFKYAASEIPVTAFLAVPAVAWACFRFRKGMWLAAGLAPLAILLLLDHTLQVNPRHPLPLAWLLTPVAAAAWEAWIAKIVKRPARRLGLALAGVLAGNLGALGFAQAYSIVQEEYYNYVDSIQEAYVALRQLPPDATVVTGPGTPAAYHLGRLKEKDFDIIGSGWAWPDDLTKEIDKRMLAGKEVYVYWNLDQWGNSVRKSGESDRLQSAVAKYTLGPAIGPYRKLMAQPRRTGIGQPDSASAPATGPRPLP